VIASGVGHPEVGKSERKVDRSPGHHKEWIEAGKPEMAKNGFGYAGPFTESLLVGNLVVRLGKKVERDAKSLGSTRLLGSQRLHKQGLPPRLGNLVSQANVGATPSALPM